MTAMQRTKSVTARLPIRIVSEANKREHWRKAAVRKHDHRATARAVLQQYIRPLSVSSARIEMTRVAPRTLDDDNLASGFKACRDGISDWLGIDDGDKRLTWVCLQQKGQAHEYAAIISVEWEP